MSAERINENIKVMVDGGAYWPRKAYQTDAGYDLKTPVGFWLLPFGKKSIDTGVHMAIPAGYAGMVKSKSGLNVNHSIQCEGVVDCGYTGSIVAKLYNHSIIPKRFEAGDKITQICIVKLCEDDLEIVERFEDTERGSGGFGSTGR